MENYQDFLDSIDRKAYHEGEWQWEEDGYTVTRTHNYSGPGCHNSCGLLLYTKDNELKKVEGDPLSAFVNGKLCMRCLAVEEMVNSPLRLKYPMKRDRKYRGQADKFERITWAEALDIAEAEVKKLDEEGLGRESIVVGHGTGRNIS
jgi:anaerobic selenocysteine-containing dehydrogenase